MIGGVVGNKAVVDVGVGEVCSTVGTGSVAGEDAVAHSGVVGGVKAAAISVGAVGGESAVGQCAAIAVYAAATAVCAAAGDSAVGEYAALTEVGTGAIVAGVGEASAADGEAVPNGAVGSEGGELIEHPSAAHAVQYGEMRFDVAGSEVEGGGLVAGKAAVDIDSGHHSEGVGPGVTLIGAFCRPHAGVAGERGVEGGGVDVVQGVGPGGAVAQSRSGGGYVDDAVGVVGEYKAEEGGFVAANIHGAVLETRVACEVEGEKADGAVGVATVDEEGTLLEGPVVALGIFDSCTCGGSDKLGTDHVALVL